MHSFFIVTGVIPRSPAKGSYATTIRYTVVCTDIFRAIELCQKDNPGMTIQSVAHQSTIQKVEV